MRKVCVAATQTSLTWNLEENLEKTEALVREAAGKGAQIILLSELFETPYFCIQPDEKFFELAKPVVKNAAFKRFTAIAKELKMDLRVSAEEEIRGLDQEAAYHL